MQQWQGSSCTRACDGDVISVSANVHDGKDSMEGCFIAQAGRAMKVRKYLDCSRPSGRPLGEQIMAVIKTVGLTMWNII